MELSYNELRKKEVVNATDGKKLGRVCDLAFCYPENRVLGIVVPGSRAFGLKREEYFIDMKNIAKIGEDVILVNIGFKGQRPAEKNCPPEPRRLFEECE
jgi:YlmC/YmxH family sporulation protein